MRLGGLEKIETESRPQKKKTESEDSHNNIMWYVIESRLLDNEQILLVTKKKYLKAARREYPDMVIYFPQEIKELMKHNGEEDFDDLLRKIHLLKKGFKGWLMPSINGPGG